MLLSNLTYYAQVGAMLMLDVIIALFVLGGVCGICVLVYDFVKLQIGKKL